MIGEIGFVPSGAIPLSGGRTISLAAIENAVLRLQAKADSEFSGDLQAAAQSMGPGEIIVPRFEQQIVDRVRRAGASTLRQRASKRPATGQPSLYVEQKAIVSGSFVDPRNIVITPGSPQRVERNLALHCIAAGTNMGIFGAEMTRQQGVFPNLTTKDITDMIDGVIRTSARQAWRGTAADVGDVTALDYQGGLTQINRTFTVGPTASIVDACTKEIASMRGQEDFEVGPSAIYGNAQTLDLFNQEERQNHRQMSQVDVTRSDGSVISGLRVNALATGGGLIPLIEDNMLPQPVTVGNTTTYKLAILTEELVEFQYLTTPDPRIFVLGLLGDLSTQYVCVLFDGVVFKGKADVTNTPEVTPVSYAHSIGTITRTV